MSKPVTAVELAVGLVGCFILGALCQHFMPLPTGLAVKATVAVATVTALWRMAKNGGVGPSLMRSLVFAVGWLAGCLAANYFR
ncbi:hypothetical protein A3C96_03655 [Candidatus Uhrbacteria bacterium RIFCSPHIGHO2_02_FULL_60_10]|uniref:Uncharacterized protein n=1 Tax=Candidatus Uhrbacteria bacterium RIFCSPHIGHO2_02_FULL_60_10 TaxID=1802392 RepID=A0A1F7U362_9BACT|nr:MAG: hypothetical protein A3C96_03655 [Candidatus Uhrbacteria bacterium RIFCSPHIGHO2_02_FULL_60_10]